MLQIDALSRTPVYEQIIEQMERLILSGVLKPGEQAPSVRSLSLQLSINPNTIQKAYSELDSRGVFCAVPGRGCFIAQDAQQRLGEYRRKRLDELTNAIYEMALAGIGEEEILQCVAKAYQRGKTE